MERLQSMGGAAAWRSVMSDSPSRTRELGRLLGELLPAGAVISLEGGLGAGKTLIAKGICAGLGIDDEIVSPSFILVEEYHGVFPVLHFDLYRLEELGEVEKIGLFDAIDGQNVVIIEWGDRLPAGRVRFDVRLHLVIRGAGEREIRIMAPKPLCDAFLDG
jgi:tRNA threonylcarbamoyladenosine biosynthesis protein TsaE